MNGNFLEDFSKNKNYKKNSAKSYHYSTNFRLR